MINRMSMLKVMFYNRVIEMSLKSIREYVLRIQNKIKRMIPMLKMLSYHLIHQREEMLVMMFRVGNLRVLCRRPMSGLIVSKLKEIMK